MLDTLREYSIKIWEPLGDVFNYLYDSSNIWVPIILFIIISLLSIYFLNKLIHIILDVKIDFTTLLSLFVKAIIVLIVAMVIFSLGFYLYDKYEVHEQKVIKKEQDLGYLLK